MQSQSHGSGQIEIICHLSRKISWKEGVPTSLPKSYHFWGAPKRCEVAIIWTKMDPTVDGQNPAPVDMANLPFFTGFHTSQWCRISSINSMGCWLFFFRSSKTGTSTDSVRVKRRPRCRRPASKMGATGINNKIGIKQKLAEKNR